ASGYLPAMSRKFTRRAALRTIAASGLAPLILRRVSWAGPPCEPAAFALTESDLDALVRGVAGETVFPATSGYDQLRRSWNGRFASWPVAIVRAVSAADVSAVVRWARPRGIRVTTRSGGHSYIGGSVGDGVIVDLSSMNGVVFDGRTNRAEVEAGTRLGPLYDELYCGGRGRMLISGTCSSVGVSGITLGGGYNERSRLYGLTVDALRRATVVLADGTIVDADARREPDLFWALRGGGPSFGIATAFEFDTLPWEPLPNITMTWPWAASAEAFSAWSAWIATLPPTAATTATWATNGSVASRAFRTVVRSLEGASAAAALADSLEHTVGVQTTRASGTLTPPGCASTGEATGAPITSTGLFADGAIPFESARALREGFEARSRIPEIPVGDWSYCFCHAFDGAVAARLPDETAFVHRDKRLLAQLFTNWPLTATAERAEAHKAWQRGLRDTVRPGFGEGSYFNYADESLPDWRTAYWGGNLCRLEAVKASYDPGRFWTGRQFV
ncbi:MAG: hypothetical protein RI967_1267, partial [Planctomycetota bacterium]